MKIVIMLAALLLISCGKETTTPTTVIATPNYDTQYRSQHSSQYQYGNAGNNPTWFYWYWYQNLNKSADCDVSSIVSEAIENNLDIKAEVYSQCDDIEFFITEER